MDHKTIQVSIVYARKAHDAYMVMVTLPEKSTIADAISACDILTHCPDIDIHHRNAIGVFGQLCAVTTILKDQDRIEIYQPLIADPKLIRRKKAQTPRPPSEKH